MVSKKSEHHAIVQELCAGSVYDYLQKFGMQTISVDQTDKARLNLPTRVRYAHDAVKGILFLHSRRIIHCDLKSQNLLVANDQQKTVKICDFSMSRLMTTRVVGPHRATTTSTPNEDAAAAQGSAGAQSPREVRCVRI